MWAPDRRSETNRFPVRATTFDKAVTFRPSRGAFTKYLEAQISPALLQACFPPAPRTAPDPIPSLTASADIVTAQVAVSAPSKGLQRYTVRGISMGQEDRHLCSDARLSRTALNEQYATIVAHISLSSLLAGLQHLRTGAFDDTTMQLLRWTFWHDPTPSFLQTILQGCLQGAISASPDRFTTRRTERTRAGSRERLSADRDRPAVKR
jgi:hypothetical protein